MLDLLEITLLMGQYYLAYDSRDYFQIHFQYLLLIYPVLNTS